ncbi:MAG: CinA family nicotinamide mononucleotide deamidase-related protein [Bacillota bacterium]
MKAEVIFTGTELLLGQILNTNAQYLQQNLAALGVDLYFQVTVGDNLERLIEAITQASKRADLVIIGGGLGPTEDDLSREALSGTVGIPLEENEQARAITERFFKDRGIDMSANNLKQALAPAGSIILDNPVGTAPGLVLEHNSTLYFLVPGPPGEFKEMISNRVIPLLREKMGSNVSVIKSRVIKLCGIGESKVDEILAHLLQSQNPTLAPTAKYSEIHLRITSKAGSAEEADSMNSEMEKKIRNVLGEYIYGIDEETLPFAVGRLLDEKRITLALAEVTSGGFLSHMMTSYPRCSDYFKAALVANIEQIEKLTNIKITPGEGSAQALARGIKEKFSSDIGIALTETESSLYPSGKGIIIATSFKDKTLTREVRLPVGGALEQRQRAVQFCLVLLWHTLKKL